MMGLILHASEITRMIYCAWDKRIEDKTIQDASRGSHNSIISHLQQWHNSLPCEPPTAVGCTDVPLVPPSCALPILAWLTCHLHPTKTQTGGNLYRQERATGSDEPACSLNQIYSPLGTLLGLGTFIVPFVGCCHSPQHMKLPLPAPPEPVAEALVACPSSDVIFFKCLPQS